LLRDKSLAMTALVIPEILNRESILI